MNPTFSLAFGVTGALSKAGLAEGTNANTFKIAATDPAGVLFAIGGLAYYKANADNIASSAGHADIEDGYTGIFLVQLDSSGNVTTKQGVSVPSALLEAGEVALEWPTPDA